MRSLALLLPVALAAAPADAAAADKETDFTLPSELTDPAMAQTLAKMLSSLTKAMMDMPVGEMQAAVEGRESTDADKRRTVRDLAGGGPDLDRRIEQQVSQAMPRMQGAMKAMAKSLPAMAKAMEKAADEMEGSLDRATANLPQPGYPRR